MDTFKTPTNDFAQDPLSFKLDQQTLEHDNVPKKENSDIQQTEVKIDTSENVMTSSLGDLKTENKINTNSEEISDIQSQHLTAKPQSSHKDLSQSSLENQNINDSNFNKQTSSDLCEQNESTENQNIQSTSTTSNISILNIEEKKRNVDPVRKISRFTVQSVAKNKPKITQEASETPTKETTEDKDKQNVSESNPLTEVKKYTKFKVSKVADDVLKPSDKAKINGMNHQIINTPVPEPLSTSSPILNNTKSYPTKENQKRSTPNLTPQQSQIMNMANQVPQSAIQNYLNTQTASQSTNINPQMLNYQLTNNLTATDQMPPNYITPLQVSISNQLGSYSNQPMPPIGLTNQMAALNISTNPLTAGLNLVASDQARLLLQQNLRELV